MCVSRVCRVAINSCLPPPPQAFDYNTLSNDIALLFLDRSSAQTPLTLPNKGEVPSGVCVCAVCDTAD